jgi:hypothetical protein
MAVIHPRSRGNRAPTVPGPAAAGEAQAGPAGYAEIAARTRAALTASESVAMS